MTYRKNELPTNAALLAEASRLFAYKPETGELIWQAFTNPIKQGKTKLGTVAGGDDGHGYRMVAVLGHKFKVHQVVWLICTGEFPTMPIDHADRDRRNNRFGNLRQVTDLQNQANLQASTRPYAGVKKDEKGHGWSANINVSGRKKYLGYFKTKDDARAAYVAASREIRGEFSPV